MQTDPITYAQLKRLLTELGYQEMPTEEEARVFVNSQYDAISVLPCADEEETARSHHLITLRKVAVEKGIVDLETFEKKLREVRQQTAEISNAA
jgi:hypothetical protein